MNQRRLQRLTDEILAHGLDGVALVPGPNMLYLSGIHAHLSERPLVLFLPADDDPAVIIPLLEAGKAEAAGIAQDRIFAWSDQEGYTGAFQQACAHLELSDYLLGVEALYMRVLEIELLHRYAPGLNTAHVEPVMAALRLSKDETELAAMAEAATVAETAIEQLLPRIKTGQTEKEIAGMLVQELYTAGSEALPFGPIVASGSNAALPHAVPTDRPIQHGDLLIIDWGATVNDYPSDITRTFAVGQVEEEFRHIHEVVRQANVAGKLAVRPGVNGETIDQAARNVIEEAGYGPHFIHRTGHGLGLEVHEFPSLVAGSTSPLGVGAVFTVEPGVYLPGRGGVRIEDDVVITKEGYRCLTQFPRELIQVG
ncbi:MAG: Xaa-Pro peptidase family protein [Chloroflexi bacterium]|nr:Xaa-Pro peptidase family protein [Chloroflexota bacterium]MCI0575858.1 Xaa-Pro peptidase family protein [Chloroflexota bacterium]MCI0646585.1 Xaa-Pro peptidase family protein [Chloroflexota bacterium]MCI0726387.1 Xaa-Pro peptidase family protein [Chloroflexota bacterium]